MNRTKRRLQGYQDGYEQGIRYGGCEAVLGRTQPFTPVLRDLKVMYVPQGFDAIDEGIIDALNSSVRECVVADRSAMARSAMEHTPDLVLVLNGLHIFPKIILHRYKRFDHTESERPYGLSMIPILQRKQHRSPSIMILCLHMS